MEVQGREGLLDGVPAATKTALTKTYKQRLGDRRVRSADLLPVMSLPGAKKVTKKPARMNFMAAEDEGTEENLDDSLEAGNHDCAPNLFLCLIKLFIYAVSSHACILTFFFNRGWRWRQRRRRRRGFAAESFGFVTLKIISFISKLNRCNWASLAQSTIIKINASLTSLSDALNSQPCCPSQDQDWLWI